MTLDPKVEEAATILDSILVLFNLYREDYHAVEMALRYIADVRNKNPQHPIRVSLAAYMRENGYFE